MLGTCTCSVVAIAMSWSSFSVVVTSLLLVVVINGVVTSPTVQRNIQDVVNTVAMPRSLPSLENDSRSVSNVTKNLETEIEAVSTTEIEEGRGRKKKYKKFLYHQFWNIIYYYAWFVGIVVVKFKAISLFLLGNLTFFIIALIRVLIKEVPMWNYLKKPPPSPIYGSPQFSYGPPKYGPPAPTYGTPSNTFENSYSASGLYKRQGAEVPNGGVDGSSAHDLAYSGQRE